MTLVTVVLLLAFLAFFGALVFGAVSRVANAIEAQNKHYGVGAEPDAEPDEGGTNV